MSEPLMHRLPSATRYDKKYRVHGHDHLIVEAYYSDAADGKKPEFGYWGVHDSRFSALDKYRRGTVLTATYLSDIRSWIKAGGANLWDPEKRKTDREWKPVPEGWTPGDERLEARRRVPFRPYGEKGSRAHQAARRAEARATENAPSHPVDPKSKKYAVAPGYVTSVNDGQKHWIGFGALTWLYGVKPSECIRVEQDEPGWNREGLEHLIWLHPQRRHEDYESMKEELARGDDAFKLIEP